MKLPYQLFIGLRYLKSRRKQKFISIITIISIFGIALGVMALIIVLSVMAGFNADIREKILGAKSHIVVYGTDYNGMKDYEKEVANIKSINGVIGASPFISSQAMVNKSQDIISKQSLNLSINKAEGVAIFGIDPDRINEVTNLGRSMKKGNISDLSKGKSIIVGSELADRLGVNVSDTITIFVPVFFKTPVGIIPKATVLTVAGIFKTGMYEYDNSFVYVSLSEAQKLFNMVDRATGIEVKVKDIYKAREISKTIRITSNRFFTFDWMELNRNLFYALKLEKIAMAIMLALIILVAGFNILSTLVMLVMEKTKDIGILKALGSSSKDIMLIFVMEGTIIGIIGIIIGTIAGITSCLLLAKYQFIKLSSDVYYITALPVKMGLYDILFIILIALAITVVSTIYPAIRASKLDPVDAIRYE